MCPNLAEISSHVQSHFLILFCEMDHVRHTMCVESTESYRFSWMQVGKSRIIFQGILKV